MTYTKAPKQRTINLRWKKWIKASDPTPYKGCIIFLYVVFQLCCSGLCNRNQKGDGCAHVCWLARRTKFQALSGSSTAILVMAHLLVLLHEDMRLCSHHGQWKESDIVSVLIEKPLSITNNVLLLCTIHNTNNVLWLSTIHNTCCRIYT